MTFCTILLDPATSNTTRPVFRLNWMSMDWTETEGLSRQGVKPSVERMSPARALAGRVASKERAAIRRCHVGDML